MFSSNKIIGILGGGQLGKMTLEVSNKWGIKIYILDPDENCPSKSLCNKFFQGDLMDFNTVYNFGKEVDIITIEIENINVEALEQLKKENKIVYPQPQVLKIVQDKSLQKEFYFKNNIPSTPFRIFNSKDEIKKFLSKEGRSYPFIWKSSKMGYDGYGVKVIDNNNSIEDIPDKHCIIEDKVEIKKELSVMVVSRPSGELINYPVVEMEFNTKSNQVEYIISPARISQEIKEKAENLALRVCKSFGNIGLLAVEMFLTIDGDLLVNEVAPRPHNSYHFSIEGSETSQFEQLIRSILDLPIGNTNMTGKSVMVNLVGEPDTKGPVVYKNMNQIIGIKGVNPHIYEKKETRPNRKMGHITVINSDIETAIKIAKEIKQTVRVTST
jgi:5-(carboxyamino)imidazole ribonucleotide synthase|tara:strand:- start:7974 stop:9122 length:1149 start_codon:yes stop_codon:yes gene_type:complete